MGDHHHHHHHHQVLMVSNNNISRSTTTNSQIIAEKKSKPQEQYHCPRCKSTNTKFCYYNNYSLTQPRYFCKTCRRYWTEGGSLRNVPVGGGSRKNKKSSNTFSSPPPSSSPSSSKSLINNNNVIPDLNPPSLSQFSTLQGGQDLNLAFPSSANSSIYMATNLQSQNDISPQNQNPSFLVPGGFAFQELKPSGGLAQGFSVDGLGIRTAARFNNNNNFRVVQERNILFPFGGEMKHVEADQTKLGQGNTNSNNNNQSGYWSGLLGGGSW